MKIELISPLMRSPRNIGEAFHLPQMSLALLASLTPPEIDVSITDELIQPIDFNKEVLDEVLKSAGYESGKKTLFIWEGVTYYLEPDSVDATLAFVKNSAHEKSVLAFDYAVTISEEKIDDYYGVRQFTETWEKHRTGEPFIFSIPEGSAASFLEQRGLKMMSHLDNSEIEKTFLTNEDGSLIGRITGSFRFASASPVSMERGA